MACGLLLVDGAVAASSQQASAQLPATPSGRTNATPVALPQRTLKVELRCVPISAAPAAQGLSPGSVVVGTGARVDPGPVLTVRSGAQREILPVQQLLVANGERASLSLQQVTQQWALDAIWADAPSQRTAPPGAGASAAGLLRRESRVSMRQLEVWPRWPGGAQPVQLWIAARQSAQPGSDVGAGRAGLRIETQLSVPLDRWVPLARLPVPASGEAALPGPAQEWQLRVSLEPE